MNRQISFLHVLLLVGIFGFGSSALAQDAAVPAGSKLRDANKLVQEIYGKKLQAAKTGPQKSELAEMIRSDAAESKEDLAQFYALLSSAIELAAQASDSSLAISLVEELAGEFEIDRRKMSIDVLSDCLLYTSPSPRDATLSRMPSSA